MPATNRDRWQYSLSRMIGALTFVSGALGVLVVSLQTGVFHFLLFSAALLAGAIGSVSNGWRGSMVGMLLVVCSAIALLATLLLALGLSLVFV